MGWQDVFDGAGVKVASRELLVAWGATGAMLTAAVRGGHLLRARRDHYPLPAESPHVVEAVRIGGRLSCVSTLAESGVFAFDTRLAHVHLDHEMSRLRSPQSRFVRLSDRNRINTRLHWWPLFADEDSSEFSVSIEDALSQAVRCQTPELAVASIDNALFLKLIDDAMVGRIFNAVPASLRPLQSRADGRSEAGQESVLRQLVRAVGLRVEPQATIRGVGRVDLIVERCLAPEADSRLAHDGWEHHVEDRRRDLALAAEGYMSLRPAYQHTMHHPEMVISAVRGLLGQRRNFAL